MQLTGTAISTDTAGRTLFRTARVGDLDLALGQVVALNGEEEEEEKGAEDEEAAQPALGMVLALFKDADGEMHAQVRGEEGGRGEGACPGEGEGRRREGGCVPR